MASACAAYDKIKEENAQKNKPIIRDCAIEKVKKIYLIGGLQCFRVKIIQLNVQRKTKDL